jgi:hypothetical protein
MRVAATVVFAACCVVSVAAQTKVSVWITPQLRDGFIDVDAGTLDAIEDIKKELRPIKAFTLAKSESSASIVLVVIGRRTSGSNGAVGVPVGRGAYVAPVPRRAIDFVLKVGDYQKSIPSEDERGGTWRGAAKQAVRDLAAWVSANWERLPKQ